MLMVGGLPFCLGVEQVVHRAMRFSSSSFVGSFAKFLVQKLIKLAAVRTAGEF